jgi:hypothetical protein
MRLMSMNAGPTTCRPFVTVELADGRYRLGYDAGARRLASVRLPRAAVEEAVIEALFVELAVALDGTVLAATPGAEEPLATVSLSVLVASALDAALADAHSDPSELRDLEAELARAFRAVRAARLGRDRNQH